LRQHVRGSCIGGPQFLLHSGEGKDEGSENKLSAQFAFEIIYGIQYPESYFGKYNPKAFGAGRTAGDA
jgi:hypothetical protein